MCIMEEPSCFLNTPDHKLPLSDLKVYGRDDEISVLESCYQKVVGHQQRHQQQQVVMCHGPSGCGKTRLVMSTFGAKKQQGEAFFVSGKFDQILETVCKPYSGIVRACTQLCEDILMNPDGEAFVENIHASMGDDDTGALSRVLPAFERLFNPLNTTTLRSELDQLDSSQKKTKPISIDKFITLLQHFLRVVASQQTPIIMFVDDLQYADPNSIEVFFGLANAQIHNFMLIGAYHQQPNNPILTKKLDEAASAEEEKYVDIPLKQIQFHSVNRMIADLLNLKSIKTEPLSNAVYKKTSGTLESIILLLLLRYIRYWSLTK